MNSQRVGHHRAKLEKSMPDGRLKLHLPVRRHQCGCAVLRLQEQVPATTAAAAAQGHFSLASS